MQDDESILPSQPPMDQSESAPADEQSEEEEDTDSNAVPVQEVTPSLDSESEDEKQSESPHQSVEAPKPGSPVKQASAKASPMKSQAEVINGHNGVHNEQSESKSEPEHNDSDNEAEPLQDHN